MKKSDIICGVVALVLAAALYGPAVMRADTSHKNVEPIPPLAALKRDMPERPECHQSHKSAEPITCAFGDPDGDRVIAIFGDSHARQWIPALDLIGKSMNIRVQQFTKSGCSFARHNVRYQKQPYPTCVEWRENVIAALREMQPDLVIATQSLMYSASDAQIVAGMASVFNELDGHGIATATIHDTPRLSFDPGDCLANNPRNCSEPRQKAARKPLMKQAADLFESVHHIDMTDLICGPDRCDVVVGNVIVYRDTNHLTRTYASMLAPYLWDRMNF